MNFGLIACFRESSLCNYKKSSALRFTYLREASYRVYKCHLQNE